MNSMASSIRYFNCVFRFKDFATTLTTADWFNTDYFPHAIFEATAFTKLGDNQYQAKGNITFAIKPYPITLTFTT